MLFWKYVKYDSDDSSNQENNDLNSNEVSSQVQDTSDNTENMDSSDSDFDEQEYNASDTYSNKNQDISNDSLDNSNNNQSNNNEYSELNSIPLPDDNESTDSVDSNSSEPELTSTNKTNDNQNMSSNTNNQLNNGNENTDSKDNLDNKSEKEDNNSKTNEPKREDNYSDNRSNKEETSKKKDLLKQLRDRLNEYKDKAGKRKKEYLNKSDSEYNESEENNKLSDQTNNFLDELKDLPSFEERDRGDGYSIDTKSYTDVPEIVIRTLITKFLNKRFCKRNIDLNTRSNSLEKANGFYKWEVKDVITHLQTHQVTKVLTDKYGYQYAEGKVETIPLSFYFDLSGSMSKYTNMLAVIAIELLKKDVKVLLGYNEKVNIQIDKINKNITLEELVSIIESAGYYYSSDSFKKDSRVTYKNINRNIDNYLVEKKAEKCVVFADFDPIYEVINLSQKIDVYWFCFENNILKYDLSNYCGFIYKVCNLYDLEQGLIKVNQKRFETLCYTENPINLQGKVRAKK